MSEPYVFWGHHVSLFSGKVRAYLRYKQIPFVEKIPGIETLKKEFIPRNGTHLIPVLNTPEGLSVQDSTRIIDYLEGRFPEPSIYPTTPAQTLVALLLESYGDDGLIPHAMHYRWNFFEQNKGVIGPDFGDLVDPSLSGTEKIKAGEMLQQRMRSSLPALGINAKTIEAIETDNAGLWAEFNEHFSQHDFLLGARPSIGDYGLMGPLYAHLYRDPYPGELMRRTAPALSAWVERMNSESPSRGDFLPDDEIPGTLIPVLKRVFVNWMPIGLATVQAMSRFRVANPGKAIPRFLPPTPVNFLGVDTPIAMFPDIQWQLQRPLRYYLSLPEHQRAPIDAMLASLGGLDSMQTRITNPVTYVHGRLAWDIEGALCARA